MSVLIFHFLLIFYPFRISLKNESWFLVFPRPGVYLLRIIFFNNPKYLQCLSSSTLSLIDFWKPLITCCHLFNSLKFSNTSRISTWSGWAWPFFYTTIVFLCSFRTKVLFSKHLFYMTISTDFFPPEVWLHSCKWMWAVHRCYLFDLLYRETFRRWRRCPLLNKTLTLKHFSFHIQMLKLDGVI